MSKTHTFGFTPEEIEKKLDDIQGSNFNPITDNLHEIKKDTGQLNNSSPADRVYTSNTTLTSDMACAKLIVMDGAILDCGGYDVYVYEDCKVISAQLINCGKLIIEGQLIVDRKVGDTTYVNVFTVSTIEVHGNATFNYTNLTFSYRYYNTLSINSNYIQKFNGNLTITNDMSGDKRQWFFGRYIHVRGDFYYDGTTLTANWQSSDQITNALIYDIMLFVDGNCTFDGLTTVSNIGAYEPRISVNGTMTFSEAVVDFNVDGIQGGLASVNYSGWGGGYIGGARVALTFGGGGSGTFHGGGGGSLVNGNPPSGAGDKNGGSGAGGGGNGGGVYGPGDFTTHASGGGGGSAGANLIFYYGVGDVDTTINIRSHGGNGGAGYTNDVVLGGADGGDGGDGGTIDITYNTTPMGLINYDLVGGSGGAGHGSGGGRGVTGSPGAPGSSSHLAGGSPLDYHLPGIPTFVTTEQATTSSIEFNVPNDINGSNLDFFIEIQEQISGLIYEAIFLHNSNDDSSYFSGTAPYVPGTGTVIYTPPAGLISGTAYRIRVRAMKDSNVEIAGIFSPWLTFIAA